MRQELVALADSVDVTTDAIKGRCREVAEIIAESPTLVMLGSGPSDGAVLYSAAKMVEAAGIFSMGQETEWYAYSIDMPVLVIAPPGRSHWRTSDVATTVRGLGRWIIAVTHKDDTKVTGHAHAVLPVLGEVREEFSPLIYHLFASHVVDNVAEVFGTALVPN